MSFRDWAFSRRRFTLAGRLESVAVLAQAVPGLRGFKRAGVALIAGALSATAMAPLYLVPILFLSIPVLIWLIDGAGGGTRGIWRAAASGWLFGFGFFLAGLHWVGNAFLVDADTFGWMIPFVAVLFPGGLALFPALACAIARTFWRKDASRVVLFAALWSLSEWLRGHILTGFPWNDLGHAWVSVAPIMQSVAWIGISGLSLITVLAAAAFAPLSGAVRRGRKIDRRALIWPAAALAGLAGLGLAGFVRLLTPDPMPVDGARVRIVHAALPQQTIDDPAMREPIFTTYLALTARPGLEKVTHVIWPEAAVPFVLSRTPAALDAIGAMLGPHTVLITGAPRLQHSVEGPDPKVFNSAHVIDGEGHILGTYDKSHLVPFGEYLPLRSILSRLGLLQLAGNLGSFDEGPGPRTLWAPGAGPLGPLICYEIIFSGSVIDPRARPDWLVNMTDDSWFGSGAGPRQHFDQARLRAVEEGLPVVRAANRGISAVIDPKGRVIARAPLDDTGTLDSDLPGPLPPTFYARWRELPYAVAIISMLLICFWPRSKAASKLLPPPSRAR